jgi:polysaccharide biosynthesis transport protein
VRLPAQLRQDAERFLAAAHSVHQARVSLRAQAMSKGMRSYLVTSAGSGDGKTSLTVSLGLSFAQSRLRTLLIDADLIGRNLTEYFDAGRANGLHEALASGTMGDGVRRSDVDPCLYVLPAGRAGTQDALSMPLDTVRAVLAEAREQFDVILIDSGPILGSVEASVLSQEVDGVIFAVAAGQQRRFVEQAMRRLESLGVRIAGIMFNRANRQDFRRSAFGSSARSSISGVWPPRHGGLGRPAEDGQPVGAQAVQN